MQLLPLLLLATVLLATVELALLADALELLAALPLLLAAASALVALVAPPTPPLAVLPKSSSLSRISSAPVATLHATIKRPASAAQEGSAAKDRSAAVVLFGLLIRDCRLGAEPCFAHAGALGLSKYLTRAIMMSLRATSVNLGATCSRLMAEARPARC